MSPRHKTESMRVSDTNHYSSDQKAESMRVLDTNHYSSDQGWEYESLRHRPLLQ